jgi:hypothetical protein
MVPSGVKKSLYTICVCLGGFVHKDVVESIEIQQKIGSYNEIEI